MNVQQAWQSQVTEARVSLAYVQHRARSLETRTRLRNALEYAMAVVGVGYLAWNAWEYFLQRPLALAGLGWFGLAFLFFTWHWHRMAAAQATPMDAGVLDTLRFQRLQLERQRDARRLYWRYWLPALVPGVVLVVWSMLVETQVIPWTSIWMVLGWFVVGSAGGVGYYEYTARRLQREIDALDTLASSN